MKYIYIIDTSKYFIDLNKLNKIKKNLSKKLQYKIEVLKNHNKVLESIIGEILIRVIVIKKFNLRNDDIEFYYNCNGKPYLKNFKNFKYNISHSYEIITCVVGEHDIGVDVEYIRNTNLLVAKRFFTKEEYKYIQYFEFSKRIDIFFRIWTLKESFLKAIGTGLKLPLDSFNLIKDNNIIDKIIYKDVNYYFKEFLWRDIYRVTVCSNSLDLPNYIKEIDCNKLIEYFLSFI